MELLEVLHLASIQKELNIHSVSQIRSNLQRHVPGLRRLCMQASNVTKFVIMESHRLPEQARENILEVLYISMCVRHEDI